MSAETAGCTRCKQTQPRSAFARNKNKTSGLNAWCKACNNTYRAERGYRSSPEAARVQKAVWRQNNPEKWRAETAVYRALKSARIHRQPCEVCGEPKAHAHHDDYSRPLTVRWLCHKHHMEHHALVRQQQLEAA